jgi:mannose-6-phosphate isomerase-like protein (cupin superfamily)
MSADWNPAAKVYRFDELPREIVREGLSRIGVRSDDSIVTLNWFEPDFRSRGQHSHPFDQLSFVFAGTLEFTIGDEVHVLTPGSMIRIPGGVPHSAQPLGDDEVLNVDVFAPIREDYLYLADYQNDNKETS